MNRSTPACPTCTLLSLQPDEPQRIRTPRVEELLRRNQPPLDVELSISGLLFKSPRPYSQTLTKRFFALRRRWNISPVPARMRCAAFPTPKHFYIPFVLYRQKSLVTFSNFVARHGKGTSGSGRHMSMFRTLFVLLRPRGLCRKSAGGGETRSSLPLRCGHLLC